MEATFDRMALLFREANLVKEEQWKNYFRSSNKDIIEVLQQDVSLATFKDLIFAEIPTPFGKSRKSSIHEVLSNQLRLSAPEMLSLLRAFKPPLEGILDPLKAAGIINSSDVQSALRSYNSSKSDPYEPLMQQNVLTPDSLNRFFSHPELRAAWPYRHDLMLSILESNGLISDDEGLSLRNSPSIADAMADYFSRDSSVGIGVFNRARNGLKLPQVDLKQNKIDAELVKKFPTDILRRMRFVPLEDDGQFMRVAFADPMNLVHGDFLNLITGRRVLPYAAPADLISSQVDTILGAKKVAVGEKERAAADVAVESTSTVQLVSSIIEGAINIKATDIHLEPRDDGDMRVRYRLDGRLRNIMRIPRKTVPQVISRIKVLANMDVTERRRPQDGHFDLEAGDVHFDFRISTLPCHLGEKVVIRVLDETRVGQGLGELGLLDSQRQLLERLSQYPYGMILTTGPTGSGKTSTLYACLQMINNMETNIVTVEDPVEYQLQGVNQVSVNQEIDLGFAQGLRAILRQDPDVIMVGEIRDAETAAIAVRAALTGHLVFSTLHTNTALGAFNTLNHMGIPPYMSAAALISVVAQRLIRRICPECSEMVATDPALATMLWSGQSWPANLQRGKGCDVCMGTGYRGRTGLYEIIEVKGDLKVLAAEGSSEPLLAEALTGQNSISMREAGRQKVEAGETTLEEVCKQILTLAI